MIPVISVIVPIYNVKSYLNSCLESIRIQTYTNYECIMVDDGSTDGSSSIADDYAKRDNRFRVIHQKNAGVGSARNKGLDVAKGDYVTFIDSDDRVLPHYFEAMVEAIKEFDILVCGFTMCSEHNNEQIGSVQGIGETANMATALKEGLLNSCWGKLYRKEIVSKHRFLQDIFWGEDTAFFLSCLCETHNLVFIKKYDYMYRHSMNGLANRFDINKPLYLMTYYRQLSIFLDKWTSKNDLLYCEIVVKISQEMLRTIDVLLSVNLTKDEKKNYLQILFSDMKVNRYFKIGINADNNPSILKILSHFPFVPVWMCYLNLRNK